MHVIAEKIHDQRRHHGARKEIRGQHGENHRLGQRHKQISGGAGEEEHRDEDDANAQRRDKSRNRNLRGAVQNRGAQFLALAKIALDVFDFHRRVIHQNSDRQRQVRPES